MNEVLEPLAALLRRYRAVDEPTGDVPRASLAEVLRGGQDPLHVVNYFHGLGLPVRELEDLLKINTDTDEEELHAFRVEEGVAITVASQGEWVLYTERPGNDTRTSCSRGMRTTGVSSK